MALGKTNRFDGKSYSLKLKLKDGAEFLEVPQFDIQEKQGDKYVTTGNVRDVSGDLFRVEVRKGEFDKQPIRSYKLALRDTAQNEAYFVEVGLGSALGRSLANSLLNLETFNGVEIGLYGQKREGKTYPAVSVRQAGNSETIKWKFDPKTTKELQPREFKGKGGKTEKDFSDAEEFLFARLQELGSRLSSTEGSASAQPEPQKSTVSPASKNKEDEDVPF